MKRILLAAVALGGLTAVATAGAVAAPLTGGLHVAPSRPVATQVDYYWHRHHWHHRHWEHHRWRYWD